MGPWRRPIFDALKEGRMYCTNAEATKISASLSCEVWASSNTLKETAFSAFVTEDVFFLAFFFSLEPKEKVARVETFEHLNAPGSWRPDY